MIYALHAGEDVESTSGRGEKLAEMTQNALLLLSCFKCSFQLRYLVKDRMRIFSVEENVSFVTEVGGIILWKVMLKNRV